MNQPRTKIVGLLLMGVGPNCFEVFGLCQGCDEFFEARLPSYSILPLQGRTLRTLLMMGWKRLHVA